MFNPYSTFRDLQRNADFLLNIGHSTLYNMSCRVHAYPGLDMNEDLARSRMLGPDYTHYRVDSIIFVDKDVQRLADMLTGEVDVELMRREDFTTRNFDINMALGAHRHGRKIERRQMPSNTIRLTNYPCPNVRL